MPRIDNYNRLVVIPEFFVVLLGGWTLAYHLCLWQQIPSGNIWTLFLLLFLPLMLLIRILDRPIFGISSPSHGPCLAILIVAVLCGLFTLILNRPDADDVSFFHRSLTQLPNLLEPFDLTNTQYDHKQIAPLSFLHLLTSYEMLMALSAHMFSVNALWVYQNAGSFWAGFLFAVVLWLLYQQLGVSPWIALGATVTAIAFLILDGNLHRSFGNMSFVRFWQGKTILWILWLPLALFFQYRFLCESTARNFLILFLVGVSSLGFSGSAVMIMPLHSLVISAAFLVSSSDRIYRWREALMCLFAYTYPVSAGIYFMVGPKLDMGAWIGGWHPVWYVNLYEYMIGSIGTLVRNFWFLFIVPLVSLAGPSRLFIVAVSVFTILLYANPLTGPVLVKLYTPASYWRLYYILPLPLTAGLTYACFITKKMTGKQKLALAIGVTAIFCTIYAYERSTISASNGFWFKEVSGPKLPPRELDFSKVVNTYVPDGSTFLAPEEVAWVMALVNPTFRFISIRSAATLHSFKNSNLFAEGKKRVDAQSLVTSSPISISWFKAFVEFLDRIDFIVAPERVTSDLYRVFSEEGISFSEIIRQQGYILIRIDPGQKRGAT